MSNFKNTVVKLGDVQSGSSNDVLFEFDTLTKKDVTSASAGCGCTSVVVGEKGISATYTASSGHTFPKLVNVILDENKFDGFYPNRTRNNEVTLEIHANVI
jgi:hypothetical protein